LSLAKLSVSSGYMPQAGCKKANAQMDERNQRSRARVFISCGQTKDSEELETAHRVGDRLRELGFDPYVAVEEQTLLGLKENLFPRLRDTEYFIFVDFGREKLVPRGRGKIGLVWSRKLERRGSLYSHQELALASYLDLPLLAFQEKGVKKNDGLLQSLQANLIQFTDRHLLPNVIADEVQRRHWDPEWRGELVLEREQGQFTDANRLEQPLGQQAGLIQGRFFHIDVRNRHRDKTAMNCYAYLEKAINLDTSVEIPLRAVEFKWAGLVLPNAHIPPGKARRFDAFWIPHHLPTKLQFNVYSDATDYIPHIEGEGRYEFSYLVLADNFPASRASFILSLNKSLSLTTFENSPVGR
jgi:hypothetical protein